MIDWDALVARAKSVRELAYAPYSDFKVGASLLMADGRIYDGCNVENRGYGLTICAERTAIVSAIAAGNRTPKAIAVVTDTRPSSPPCGMCLDTLAEFADPELPIALANLDGEREVLRLGDLFPRPFVLPPRR